MANQPTDNYSRFMTQVFDNRKDFIAPTGFQSFFGDPSTGARTEFLPNADLLEIDIIKSSGRTIAQLVERGEGRNIGSFKGTSDHKYTTRTSKFPLVQDEGSINSSQLTRRSYGEAPYEGSTKFDRLRILSRI